MCVCVCVCESKRDSENETGMSFRSFLHINVCFTSKERTFSFKNKKQSLSCKSSTPTTVTLRCEEAAQSSHIKRF